MRRKNYLSNICRASFSLYLICILFDSSDTILTSSSANFCRPVFPHLCSGLLPILDSECTRGAAASDGALVSTYNKSFRGHAHYGVCGPSTAWRKQVGSKTSTSSHFTADTDFAVLHYAGGIIYSSNDFIDKNRDALFDHVNALLATSSYVPLVTSLFKTNNDLPSFSASSSESPQFLAKIRASTGESGGDDDGTGGHTNLRASNGTVSQRFNAQLNGLLQTLEGCDVRFVRCIKSNQLLAPQVLDKPSVLNQLVCSGVMAALEVRRAGFPTRVPYCDFIRDFRVFTVGFPSSEKENEAITYDKLLRLHRNETQIRAAVKPRMPSLKMDSTTPSTHDHPPGIYEVDDHDEANGQSICGELNAARSLTAMMMTHPAVLKAVTARQYRLGLTKLFLHADTLLVLQNVKHKIILPKIIRLQRWWVRISESVLLHKLNRAAQLLHELESQVDVGGMHGMETVRRALDETATAVMYARRLNSLQPEVFRPAVERACKKARVAEELVERVIAIKKRDSEQRVELLGMLDTGRARLSHAQRDLDDIELQGEARYQVIHRMDKAAKALREQSTQLLQVANRNAIRSHGKNQDSEKGYEPAALHRLHLQATENADERMIDGTSLDRTGKIYKCLDEEDPEEVARRRVLAVEGVLTMVKDAEIALVHLQSQQQRLYEAREKTKEIFVQIKKDFRHTLEAAESSGIVGDGMGVESRAIQQNVATVRDNIAEVDCVLETSQDPTALQPAVEHAAFLVSELSSIVQNERLLKSSEERRRQGRQLWEEAHCKFKEFLSEIESSGIKGGNVPASAHAITDASTDFESAIEQAASLLTSDDSYAYVHACQSLHGKLEKMNAILKAEILVKQRHDKVREIELARVKVAHEKVLNLLRSVEMHCTMAAEQQLCEGLCTSLSFSEEVLADLQASPAVASLKDKVETAILQCAASERRYADVKQRHESQAREVATAHGELVAMQKRFKTLLSRYCIGGPAVADCSSDNQGTVGATNVLTTLCESAMSLCRDALRNLENAVRLGACPSLSSALSAASESICEFESHVKTQSQRVEAMCKARQEDLGRLLSTKGRFDSFLENVSLVEEKCQPGNAASPSFTVWSSMLSGSSFLGKPSLRKLVSEVKMGLQQVEEEIHVPITVTWFEDEGYHGKRQQERRSVNEAISRVEKAEGLIEHAQKRYAERQKEWQKCRLSLESGQAKLVCLENLVANGGMLVYLRAAQEILEACQASYDMTAKLVAKAHNTASALNANVDDFDEQDVEESALIKVCQTVASFIEKVTNAEASLKAYQVREDAFTKEKLNLHEKFHLNLCRFQENVAMIAAAGSTVQKLCQVPSDDAAMAINRAARLLRRGVVVTSDKNGGKVIKESEIDSARLYDPSDNDGMYTLQSMTEAIHEAVKRVDSLELEAQLLRRRVDRASAFKICESKKLASLQDALQVCAERAETYGLINESSKVELPLNRAKLSIASIFSKLEQPLSVWMDKMTLLAKDVDAAIAEVVNVKELLNQDIELQARDKQEREQWLIGQRALQDRWECARDAAVNSGVMQLQEVQSMLLAVESDLAGQEGIEDRPMRLHTLTQRVTDMEELVSRESQRLRIRELNVEKALKALPTLVDRLARLEKTLRSNFQTSSQSQFPEVSAAEATDTTAAGDESLGRTHTYYNDTKEKRSDGKEDVLQSVVPLHVKMVVQEAKSAVWKVQHFAQESLRSPQVPLPRVDWALDKLHEAEKMVAKEVDLKKAINKQRADALQHYRSLERKFAGIQDEVTTLCTKFSFFRVQLEAYSDGELFEWLGTQTNCVQSGTSASLLVDAAIPDTVACSSAQSMVRSIADARDALMYAQRCLSAEKKSTATHDGITEDGSQLASKTVADSASMAAELERAASKIDRANEILERQKDFCVRNEHQRVVVLRSLEKEQDRIARLYAIIGTQGLDRTISPVENALQAAESALNAVSQLIDAGQILVVGPAFDVAAARVQEAEDVVIWETERKRRLDRQHDAVKVELERQTLRQKALRQLVQETKYLNQAIAVTDCMVDVGKALEHAALCVNDNPMPSVPLATQHAELRIVNERLQAAEREIRRARIQHEEEERYARQQAEEARLRVMRDAEQERIRVEIEKIKRSKLESELEKLAARLAFHRPTLDNIFSSMARAEEAVKSARDTLSLQNEEAYGNDENGTCGECEKKNVGCGSMSRDSGDGRSSAPYKGITEAAAAAEAALTLTANLEQLLHGSAIGKYSSLSLSPSGINTWGEDKLDLSRPKAEAMGEWENSTTSRSVSTEKLQIYMDKTTHTLEAVARSVEVLYLGMTDLKMSVQEQDLQLNAHKDILKCASYSPGSITALPVVGEALSTRAPPSMGGPMVSRLPKEGSWEALSLLRHASTPPGICGNGGPEEKGDILYSGSDEADCDNGGRLEDDIGRSVDASKQAALCLREEKGVTRKETRQSVDEDISALLSKFYPDDLISHLRKLVTSGGVVLNDTIAKSSYSGDTLELFAGDYACYSLFAPLFDPVIAACHPRYNKTHKQPSDFNADHLREALGPSVLTEKNGDNVRMARLVASRNLCGYNYTPKMSVAQLREVERKVVAALNCLTGDQRGTYTTIKDLKTNSALQEEMDIAELPQSYRLDESAGDLSCWPEGRGVFLNQDRSLCIFVNVEDHVTIVATARQNGSQDGIAAIGCRAFALSCRALTNLGLDFEFDERLGYITPSPAKLGTALAFSLVFTPATSARELDEIERQYDVVLDRAGSAHHGEDVPCIVFNKFSLGVSEVESIQEVIMASRGILHASNGAMNG